MYRTVAIVVLGCPKNEVDAEVLAGMLVAKGFDIVEDTEQADVVILFTCGFIQSAVEESLEAVLKVAQSNKNIIVTGCLPSRYSVSDLITNLPEVDKFFGTYDFREIPEYLQGKPTEYRNSKYIYSSLDPRQFSNRDFAYIKISEGCSNSCSFCTIPAIKGGVLSRRENDICDEIKRVVDYGIKEVIFVSQNSGDYGRDSNFQTDLKKLIEKVLDIDGLEWLRLLYLYPDFIDDDFLELTQHQKFCKYLDIPIQHIDDKILTLMNRKTSQRDIITKIEKIKRFDPSIFIRTTILLGFPGEDDNAFEKLIKFIKEYQFYNLGCFTYSKEDGTKAAKIKPQVPEKLKRERYKAIMSAQRKIVNKINKGLVGKVFRTNVSGYFEETELLLKGRTYFQSPDIDGVTLINRGTLEKADFYDVKITDFKDYDLVGEIIHQPIKSESVI